MRRIDVYGKQGCARCTATKDKLTHMLARWSVGDQVTLAWYDMETEEGLTEGAFHDVAEVPTTLLVDPARGEIARWEAQVPPSEAVLRHLAGAGIVQA